MSGEGEGGERWLACCALHVEDDDGPAVVGGGERTGLGLHPRGSWSRGRYASGRTSCVTGSKRHANHSPIATWTIW